MKIAGIICEYNPFHNGHLFQLKETKQLGATHIIAVMSGNVVQRGDFAIFDKHKRAEIAVKCGADLVVELPVPYSSASAELFSKAAVYILEQLGVVDMLSFGSENGDIDTLKKAAQASESVLSSNRVFELISQGLSYPSAIAKAISEGYDKSIYEVFSSPNNTLGIEYIKALNFFESKIQPVTITRNSVSHDSNTEIGKFASASLLRKYISENKEIDFFVPASTKNTIIDLSESNEITNIRNIEKIIIFKLLTMTKKELDNLPEANNGLSDRLYSALKTATTYQELLDKTKTKCFTLARIRRVICYAVLGITSADFNVLPPFARILAFNDKGCEIMAEMKSKCKIPYSTSLSELSKKSETAKRFATLDENTSKIFSLAVNNQSFRKNEYSVKVSKL